MVVLAYIVQHGFNRHVLHYTVNTGRTVKQGREVVTAAALEVLRPLVDHGGTIPSFAPFRVEVDHGAGFAAFHVWRGREPIAYCGLAWTVEGEAEAWPEIETLYLDLGDRQPGLMAPARAPEKPASLPWLTVVLLPALVNQRCTDIVWLGDFERRMAWTILDSQGNC